MTTNEQAKMIAEKCVDEICALSDCDDAVKIVEHCCLMELLEVVKAAKVLHGEINVHGGHGTPTFGDRAVCYAALDDFEAALAALRAKLPKEL